MAAQVQDGGQVTPSTLCPDVGDVAAPDSVWRCHGELPFQNIGNVRAFDRGLLVRMRTRLFADQSLFLHQASDFEASDMDAFIPEHGNDTAATR